MSLTPVGGHPQGWDHKLADRSSLPPVSGEDKYKSQFKHVFTQPHLPKGGAVSAWCREETEGSSGSSPSSGDPPYLRWARTLHDLLEDAEGVRQFRKFVAGAGGLHLDRLNFYFAVQGLRQETDPAKIRQVVSAIYKFVRKSQLCMPEPVRTLVRTRLREGGPLQRDVYDAMEADVTRAITDTTYAAFLRSDAYVAYVGAATQPLSSPEHHAAESQMVAGICGGSQLATLHEGEELGVGGSLAPPHAPLAPHTPARLTHDALLATQARRLHSDNAPGSFSRARSVYAHAHLTYGGYCPASRQDSERGSLSSGRTDRTDSDVVSLSGSSLDGMSVRTPRERLRARLPGMDRHAVINKDPDTAMMIPRTQRMQSEQLRVLPPAEFGPLLIEKLERVRRDQEAKERLERRLQEGDGEEAVGALPPALVAAAIREKLQPDEDNDQDILDQHVSRVWSERTPGASPPGGRRARPAPRRRPPSTLSADSGHYDDAHHHAHSLSRRSFSKKTVTELTDSGVSVVSEGMEPRVLLWVEGSRRSYLSSRASSAERRAARAVGAKCAPGAGAGVGAEACTVVVMSFLDEPVPYRIKIPAAPLTLKTFKDYLPRKGNYRYFFKTECSDLDKTVMVIQEEVSCDTDMLPMYEGKVMARVKPVE